MKSLENPLCYGILKIAQSLHSSFNRKQIYSMLQDYRRPTSHCSGCIIDTSLNRVRKPSYTVQKLNKNMYIRIMATQVFVNYFLSYNPPKRKWRAVRGCSPNGIITSRNHFYLRGLNKDILI